MAVIEPLNFFFYGTFTQAILSIIPIVSPTLFLKQLEMLNPYRMWSSSLYFDGEIWSNFPLISTQILLLSVGKTLHWWF